MSDISINVTWLDVVLWAPVLGWPGLIVGGLLGALLWKGRRILGAVLGALAGSALWSFGLILLV